MHFAYLAIAIAAEIMATSALKSAAEFTRLWPSLLVVLGYVTAFYFLSLSLRVVSVGIAYAIWSGVGVVAIAVIAWLVHGERLDLPALIGIGLILAGCVVINLWSRTATH